MRSEQWAAEALDYFVQAEKLLPASLLLGFAYADFLEVSTEVRDARAVHVSATVRDVRAVHGLCVERP